MQRIGTGNPCIDESRTNAEKNRRRIDESESLEHDRGCRVDESRHRVVLLEESFPLPSPRAQSRKK